MLKQPLHSLGAISHHCASLASQFALLHYCAGHSERRLLPVLVRRKTNKVRPSDGCKGDTVPSTVVRGYDLRKLGGYLGNVGWWQ